MYECSQIFGSFVINSIIKEKDEKTNTKKFIFESLTNRYKLEVIINSTETKIICYPILL
jgi:hypothetical protein